MKRKILKSFSIIVMVLLVSGSINLYLFCDINRAAKDLVETRYSFEKSINRGSLLIGRIQTNIWDAMLFENEKRAMRVDILDAQALEFFEIIEHLESFPSGMQTGNSSLRRLFQTFYLSGKELLKLRDIKTAKNSPEEVMNFLALKDSLTKQIDRRFSVYIGNYDKAVTDMESRAVAFTFVSLGIILTGLVAATFFSIRLSGKVIKPVRDLTAVIKRISHGDVHIRAEEQTGDEIGELGAAFNRMTLSLRQSMHTLSREIEERKLLEKKAEVHLRQLLQADKMASLGNLVAGVAHEINNPNQFIMSNISPIEKAWEGAVPILDRYGEAAGDFKIGGTRYSQLKARIPVAFSNVRTGTGRIRTFTKELRRFSVKSPVEDFSLVNINQVTKSALTLSATIIRNHTDMFSSKLREKIPECRGNYQQLEQVIINLIQNACQALSERSQEIFVETGYRQNDRQVFITVSDEGTGIPDDLLGKVKEPFFTTKRDVGGTGLGLSISDNIVKRHGGTLVFSTGKKQGTTVAVLLPVPFDGITMKGKRDA